jgi:hypothetical protein
MLQGTEEIAGGGQHQPISAKKAQKQDYLHIINNLEENQGGTKRKSAEISGNKRNLAAVSSLPAELRGTQR